MKEMNHIPVMYEECLSGLNIKPNGIYLDMTVGGFGHGSGICERLGKKGTYIGLDLDPQAIERGKKKSAGSKAKTIFAHQNFKQFEAILDANGIEKIDGCLMDLGVSSFQIDEAERGFSFMRDAPLDMRMDSTGALSAKDVVNHYSEGDLRRILYQYGEEKFAPGIVKAIIAARAEKEIETTSEFAEIVKSGIPKKFWYQGKNPATKTFQAIRIEVNDELNGLYETVISVIDRLSPSGRICIISFHSLEDRIAKLALMEKSKGCDCPKDFPICVCGKTPQIKVITKSPMVPTEKEQEENIRSRSAKLRIAEKI